MNDIPDILGMKLEDASALLQKEGLVFHIIETKPPRPPRDVYENSTLRVIKIGNNRQNKVDEFRNNEEDKSILVTVCNI